MQRVEYFSASIMVIHLSHDEAVYFIFKKNDGFTY